MYFFRTLALCALLFPYHSAFAEPALVISLSGAGDRVRAQNPELAAARFRIGEALGRMRQAGRLDNPQLETEVEHNARFREGRVEVGVTQKFPVTERLKFEKEVSLALLEASEAEVAEVERKLVEAARLSVVRLLAMRERRVLLEGRKELAADFAKRLGEAAERGEGSALDVASARLEAAGIEAEMHLLDAGEAAELGILKPLLGMDPEDGLHVSGGFPAMEMPAGSVGVGNRPDYRAAVLQAEAAAKGVELEHSKRYDDVEAGVFAAAERAEDVPDGYGNDAVIGLRLSIPLPWRNRNEGAIEEAAATRERRRLEAEALAAGIRNEAGAELAQMAEWQRLVRELDEVLLPLAREQGELAEAAFSAGQGEMAVIFRAREKRLELEKMRLDAVREFHLARVRHDAARGVE